MSMFFLSFSMGGFSKYNVREKILRLKIRLQKHSNIKLVKKRQKYSKNLGNNMICIKERLSIFYKELLNKQELIKQHDLRMGKKHEKTLEKRRQTKPIKI